MTLKDMQEIRVPLDEFVRQLARDAARVVIDEHQAKCKPAERDKAIVDRVEKLELRHAFLIGLMLGSGLLGGAAGALVSTIF